MGKVLSFLSSVKDAHDRKKQEKVLKNIANNKKISWQQPEQRKTVAEGAKAAQRLSVWDRPPEDEQQRKQYKEDLAKVDDAIKVLKKNYKDDNKDEIEAAMKQTENIDDDESDAKEVETGSVVIKNTENIGDDESNAKEVETGSVIKHTETLEDDESAIKQTENIDNDEKEVETESDNNSQDDAWPNEKDTNEKQIDAEADHVDNIDDDDNKQPNDGDMEPNNEPNEEDNDIDSSDEDEPQVNESYDAANDESFSEEKEAQRKMKKKTTYSGMCIQIGIDKSQNVPDEEQLVLTNSHNFLWVTTAVQDGLNSIIECIANEEENAEELTRDALDIHLDSFPASFRDKSWEICTAGEPMDVIWPEIYKVFVDSMLIATGQYDVDEDLTSLMFEIRDMTEIFQQIVKVQKIFDDKRNTAKWSKTTLCLSTRGARTLVKSARNIRGNKKLDTSDNMIVALLTGFTVQALENAVFFCTRVFWKLLTNTWWDNDDDDDDALPMSLAKYDAAATLNSGNLLSVTQRQGLGAMSMEVLFPDLVLFGHDYQDEDIDETFTQYLRVLN